MNNWLLLWPSLSLSLWSMANLFLTVFATWRHFLQSVTLKHLLKIPCLYYKGRFSLYHLLTTIVGNSFSPLRCTFPRPSITRNYIRCTKFVIECCTCLHAQSLQTKRKTCSRIVIKLLTDVKSDKLGKFVKDRVLLWELKDKLFVKCVSLPNRFTAFLKTFQFSAKRRMWTQVGVESLRSSNA